MDPQLLEHFRAHPALRRRPFACSPIINVPVRFVHKLESGRNKQTNINLRKARARLQDVEKTNAHLVELGELLGVHRAEVLLRERAEEEVALERAALATLVYEARASFRWTLRGAGPGVVRDAADLWGMRWRRCAPRCGASARDLSVSRQTRTDVSWGGRRDATRGYGRQNGAEKSTCALTSSSPSFIRQRHAFAAH